MKQFAEATGKVIKSILFPKNEHGFISRIRFRFGDDSELTIEDQRHLCCEHRYMSSDDRLDDFVGSKLTGYELLPVTWGKIDVDIGDEMQFLRIDTSLGSFIIQNHDLHNGYYGGFDITSTYIKERSK